MRVQSNGLAGANIAAGSGEARSSKQLLGPTTHAYPQGSNSGTKSKRRSVSQEAKSKRARAQEDCWNTQRTHWGLDGR